MHRKRKNKYKEIRTVGVVLFWMFFGALVLGMLCLPEDAGMSVQEAEPSDMLEGEGIGDAAAGVERDDIACGTDKNITWRIDADGKLTVEGTGEFSGSDLKPWYSEREKIKSAVVRVTGLKNAGYMFYHCNEMVSVDLSGFDTHDVTNMSSMFSGCRSLTSVNMSGFDTSSVTDMSFMFYDCSGLISVNMSGFDTSSVTDMSYMFQNCRSLTSLDLSGFDTHSVTDMSWMFQMCINLTSLDLSSFDTGNVTDMIGMFRNCSSLTSFDLSGFDTSRVTDMRWMFKNCSSLISVNLSSFDTGNVTDMHRMFYGCSSLSAICIPYNVPALPGWSAAVLPTAAETDIWYDAAANTYTTLPEELDYSLILLKNEIPMAYRFQ